MTLPPVGTAFTAEVMNAVGFRQRLRSSKLTGADTGVVGRNDGEGTSSALLLGISDLDDLFRVAGLGRTI